MSHGRSHGLGPVGWLLTFGITVASVAILAVLAQAPKVTDGNSTFASSMQAGLVWATVGPAVVLIAFWLLLNEDV